MALLNPAVTLPSSSRDALEQWDERYIGASQLVVPETWVSQLGDETSVASLETKYPMTMLAIKYIEAISADPNFESAGEKHVDLTVAEYKAGIAYRLLDLITNVYSAREWLSSAERFAQAESMFKLKLISADLEANTELCGWDDLALFHAAHLANPKGDASVTFSNLQSTPKDCADLANIEAELTLMAQVKDVNGDRGFVSGDVIGVPPEKFRKMTNLLKQDFVATSAGTATMRNPYNDGSLTVIQMSQTTDANDWFIFDTKLIAKGVPPWIVAKLSIPAPGFDALSLRRHDETSEMFRRTGKIGVDSRVFYGRKFLFPHGVRKILGA